MAATITPQIITEHGLSSEEYQRIKEILGREPNFTELGIFSVMWSEHCSYKNSRPVLKLFPTSGKRVIQGPGENAGVVDIGDGWVVVMKIESHNHPSAIEPYQGAATGVGGILRDIFTMGARPVALLDSLRFGPLTDARVRYIFEGVVAGIAGYGNCVGVPTIAGEIYFDENYKDNCLVNVMAVGIARREEIIGARADGIGNPVIYLGATTGRDGIHGATFASEELGEKSEEKRSAVQVGDPFMEKLLIEATLEMIRAGLVVGVQDMGAAGLTSSSSEMASRAGNGIEMDINLVPKRASKMTPYEVMLSESQERMVVVGKKEKMGEINKIAAKWGLNCVVIGKVTGDGFFRVKESGQLIAEIPVRALADPKFSLYPTYHREGKEPSDQKEIQFLDLRKFPLARDWNKVLLTLLASYNLASRHPVYEQYDHMVQLNTVILPGAADAAVLRIKGTKKGIALTVDGNGRYSWLDPYRGGEIAVAEAARNLVCSGAQPLAITDCLNFGNPEKPEIFYQFRKVVEGMKEAAEYLGIPVVSGNVSFYNESNGLAIYPTPVVGMVGLLENIDYRCTPWFKREGDLVVLLGDPQPPDSSLGGSEYLYQIHHSKQGQVNINLEQEKAIQNVCFNAIQAGLISSAHDCSEGGLAVALAEACMGEPCEKLLGVRIESKFTGRPDTYLFGEAQSRIIISLPEGNWPKLIRMAQQLNVPVTIIGRVEGKRLLINDLINIDLDTARGKWRAGLISGR